MAGSYSFQKRLNELAGTSGLAPRGAANAWAGTIGLDVVGALNVKARALGVLAPTVPNLDLGGVCNKLAGTTGLAPVAALERALAPDLLINSSFEAGATRATGWDEEHTTTGTQTYSLVTSSVVDGSKAQRIVHTPNPGDNSKVFAMYQAPIAGMSPGNILRLGVWVSGTVVDCVGIVGVEGFNSSNVYISENETYLTGLTGTPQYFTVDYVCPVNNDHVAVYFQFNEVYPTSSVDVIFDKARLYIV